MSIFIAASFRGEDLKLLNKIRMSLQAITVADIATADGRSIRHSAVLLQHSNGLWKHYDWPRAVHLYPKLRDLWERALQTCLLKHPHQPSARGLGFRLWVNTWVSPYIESYWDWYWSEESSRDRVQS